MIKVHDLTFKGGPAYYYRLGLWEQPPERQSSASPRRRPSTRSPGRRLGFGSKAPRRRSNRTTRGATPSRSRCRATSPAGSIPAADVDVFEFEAKKGEEWWIEVASERLGPADRSRRPGAARGRRARTARPDKLTDVAGTDRHPQPGEGLQQRLRLRRPALQRRHGGRPRQAGDQGRRAVSAATVGPVRRHPQRAAATSTGW